LPPPWEREPRPPQDPAPTEPRLLWEPLSSHPYLIQSSRPKLPTTRKPCSSHRTMNSSEPPTVDNKNVKRHINMSLEAAIPCCISSRKSFFKEKKLCEETIHFRLSFNRGQTLHKHYPQLNCKLRLKPGPKTTILYLVIRQPALVALKIKTKVSILQNLQR